jgi:hypothetical protein
MSYLEACAHNAADRFRVNLVGSKTIWYTVIIAMYIIDGLKKTAGSLYRGHRRSGKRFDSIE